MKKLLKPLCSFVAWVRSFRKRCQRCNCRGAVTYRQRTNYTTESENIVTLCPVCRKENDAYWDDMWLDYYSGLL